MWVAFLTPTVKRVSALTDALSSTRAAIAASRLVGETRRIEHARDAVESIAADRQRRARELRDSGWTLQQIADLIGVSPQTIHKLVKAADTEES